MAHWFTTGSLHDVDIDELPCQREYAEWGSACLWYELRFTPRPYKQQVRPSKKFTMSYRNGAFAELKGA